MKTSEEVLGRPHNQEVDKDYEYLNLEAFRTAFDQYLHRYSELEPIAMRLSRKSLPFAQDEEAKAAFDSMADNFSKLEKLGNSENANPGELTVTIPVAVNSEDFQMVAQTLDHVKRSQEDFGKPINVVVWANAFYAWKPQKRATEVQSQENYAELQQVLSDYADEKNTNIYTGLSVDQGKRVHMTNVRRDYMEAVSLLCAEQKSGFMHPVLWLDADTTSLSQRALGAVYDEVKRGEIIFPHLGHRHEIDWIEGPLAEADSATRAVAVDEIIRRIAYRGQEESDYYEESGIAMAIGSYLTVGGLNPVQNNMTLSRISETLHLEQRIAAVRLQRSMIANGREPTGFDHMGMPGGYIVPPQLLTHKNSSEVFGYIPRVSTGVSARRVYRQVRKKGVDGLMEYADLFAELNKSKARKPKEVTGEHMMLALNHPSSDKPKISGKKERIARKVITRYFHVPGL